MEVELMNQGMTNQTGVVTIIWEYLPSLPSGIDKALPIWLDIGGCGSTDQPSFANKTFQYSSPPWSSNVTGRISSVVGHLHDGGVNLQVFNNRGNDNTTICDCQSAYGQNPGYIDAGDSMSMSSNMNMAGHAGEHISSISECSTGELNLGDQLSVTAFYNTTEYAAMQNPDGSLVPIMGIGIMYVAQSQTYNSTAATTATASTMPSSMSISGGAVAMATSGPALVAGAVGGMAGLLLW